MFRGTLKYNTLIAALQLVNEICDAAFSMSDEEIASENIMWTDNKIQKDGTRLGIKIDGDKIFRIAMNRGSTFVCLDSKNNTLARFLGHEKQNMEQEYETDNEYGDEGRDYDD